MSDEFLRRAFGGTQRIPIKPMLVGGARAHIITEYCYTDEDNPTTNFPSAASYRQAQDGSASKPWGDRRTFFKFPTPLTGYIALIIPDTSLFFTLTSAPQNPDPASYIGLDAALRTYGVVSFAGQTMSTLTWDLMSTLTYCAAGPVPQIVSYGEGYELGSVLANVRALEIFTSEALEGVQLDVTCAFSGTADSITATGSAGAVPYALAGS